LSGRDGSRQGAADDSEASTDAGRGYLDTPSMGLPCSATVLAMQEALDAWAGGRADYSLWEGSMEACRGLFGQILDVNAADVGLLPSVVPALAAAAGSLAGSAGPVVAHRKEFRSWLLPVLAQVPEERMRWVDGPYVADTFTAALDDTTAAVLVSAVSSHDGGRLSLARLLEGCAATGAKLLVDGTQAAGIVTLDVPLHRLALFACAGYKGLRGPRGVAYAVADDDVVADFAAPSAYGVVDMQERGSYGPPLLRKTGAQGLDQSPAWIAWVGAEKGLSSLAEEPALKRERYVLGLSRALRDHLDQLGLPVQQTDLESPIVTFAPKDPELLMGRLAERGIRGALKMDRIRFGFHIYNDESDVDLVCHILDQHFRSSR